MILPMARVQITGLKADALAVMQALHQLGTIQLEKVPTGPESDLQPLALTQEIIQEQERLGLLATQVDSLILALGLEAAQPTCPSAADPAELIRVAESEITSLADEVRDLIELRAKLDADLAALPRYEETLRRLVPLVPDIAHAPDRISTILLVPRKHQWLLDSMRASLAKWNSEEITLIEQNISQSMRAMLIVAPRSASERLAELIGQKDISQLQLPPDLRGLAPDTAVAHVRDRLRSLGMEREEVNEEISRLAGHWADRLPLYRACLYDRLSETRALDLLAMTDYTFLLQGWTPERNLAAIAPQLEQAVGARFAVESLPVDEEGAGEAPVALQNTQPARPFERLVGIFSWPAIGDLDPTLLMALFMPFFFGIILGDIGYGVILLILALLFLWRFKKQGAARDIAKVLALGAVWAIVFGFLYGEAFGDWGESRGLHPIWIGRFEPEDVAILLVFSVVVGTVHITLGLLLGLWQAWQTRSRSHLLERGGMLICLAGIFLLVAALADRLPAGLLTPALALVVVGIVVLGSSFGWLGLLLGPLEFIGLLGNILSYLRLAAVGLASVYVALVANRLAGGLGVVIVGVIIALLIHTLNIALGAFSPTIHSMRLHYVEFFSKFYEGGGRPFKPFKSTISPGAAP